MNYNHSTGGKNECLFNYDVNEMAINVGIRIVKV
jgi:hypothetical protein